MTSTVHAVLPVNATGQLSTLRVLLLHGYTQNALLFQAKTKALHKAIAKALPQHAVHFCYPTAPHRLRAADFPDLRTGTVGDIQSKDADQDEKELDAFGWWLRRESPGQDAFYEGLELSLDCLISTCREHGPFDGVIGFSQGACAAAMLASLLEGEQRQQNFEHFRSHGNGIPFPAGLITPGDDEWRHPPLRFAVSYCGFRAPGNRYRAFYEPMITKTPILHVLGQLDVVVDELRSQALVDVCAAGENLVVRHPGGHFVPSQKPWLDAVVAFIKRSVMDDETNQGPKHESDLDVTQMQTPF